MKDQYVVDLTAPVAAIIEKDSRRSDEVRQRLQQIDSTVTLNYFEQIDLLAEVNHNNYWDGWKFPSLKDYVKKSGFDLTMAEVEKGIRISTISKLLEISKVSLAKAKKTKVNIIFELDHTKIVTEPSTQKEEKVSDIIVQLIADAPSKTVIELREIVKGVKALYATEDETNSELTWMNNPVPRDGKHIVEAGLAKAIKYAGKTIDVMTKEEKDLSKAAAMVLVFGNFLSDPNFDEAEDNGAEGDFEDSHDDSGGNDSQFDDGDLSSDDDTYDQDDGHGPDDMESQ